jgi:5-methylcytosine-specific restriction protein A
MTPKPWRHTKQSRHQRGYGAAWVKLREVIIARDIGLCQPCKRQGRVTPFAAVDHITPKAQGGTDEHDNLELICGPCHAAKSQAESLTGQGKALKPKPKFDDSGRVVWR